MVDTGRLGIKTCVQISPHQMLTAAHTPCSLPPPVQLLARLRALSWAFRSRPLFCSAASVGAHRTALLLVRFPQQCRRAADTHEKDLYEPGLTILAHRANMELENRFQSGPVRITLVFTCAAKALCEAYNSIITGLHWEHFSLGLSFNAYGGWMSVQSIGLDFNGIHLYLYSICCDQNCCQQATAVRQNCP